VNGGNPAHLPAHSSLPVSAARAHSRSALGAQAHTPSQLLPTLPGGDMNTPDAFKLLAPAPHDGDCAWAMVLSRPADASTLPSRPATPVQGYAWGAESVPRELRADERRLAFAFADALGLGALDIALDARPADGKIRMYILHFAGLGLGARFLAQATAGREPDRISAAPARDVKIKDGGN
jgi:hypothetical protein